MLRIGVVNKKVIWKIVKGDRGNRISKSVNRGSDRGSNRGSNRGNNMGTNRSKRGIAQGQDS